MAKVINKWGRIDCHPQRTILFSRGWIGDGTWSIRQCIGICHRKNRLCARQTWKILLSFCFGRTELWTSRSCNDRRRNIFSPYSTFDILYHYNWSSLCHYTLQDIRDDVEGALCAGLQAILVRTGKYRPGDEDKSKILPSAVCNTFSAAVDFILENSNVV